MYWVTTKHQVLHIHGFSYFRSYNVKKIQQSTGYLTHPIIGFTIGRAPIMPSIWAPDGNVKINIITIAEIEGSKWHGENDAPKEERQSLGTAVMAHKVKIPVGTQTGNDGYKLPFLNTWWLQRRLSLLVCVWTCTSMQTLFLLSKLMLMQTD